VSLSVHRKYNFINLLKMKNQILKIGKVLNRAEQKQVFGGAVLTHEGDTGPCYSSTCRTDNEKGCCKGSCQTKNGKAVGECFGQ
jgi:hypothetical protein